MSVDFKRIKKYSKASKSIDEKLEYLNKELKKTGLDEMANTTGGLYVGSEENPNEEYAKITGKNFNGKGFAMSGDSNLGQGSFGGASIRASDGAALSPDGTTTQTKGDLGSGGFKLAIPGERPTPESRMTGPIMWYWNGSSWGSLEYNSAAVHGNQPYPFGGDNAGWGYWGSNFLGFPMLRSDGAPFASLFNTIDNFDPKDSIPTTTVITRNDLGDPGFLPINIDGLSTQGFNYLKGKAGSGGDSSDPDDPDKTEFKKGERGEMEEEEEDNEEEERKKREEELENWKEAWARRLGVSINFLNKMIYDMGMPLTGLLDDFLKGTTGLPSLNKFADGITIPIMKTIGKLLGVPTPANFMFRYDKWLGSGAKGRVDMTSYIDRGSMRKLSSVVNKLEGPYMKNETIKQQFKRLTSEGESREEALDKIASNIQTEVQKLTSAKGTGGKQLSHSIGNGAQIDKKAFIKSGGKIIKFSKGYDFAENTGSVSGKSPLHSFVKGLGVELDTTGHGLFFWGTVIAAKYGLKNVNRNYKGSPDRAPQMPYSFKIPSGGGINESYWDNYEWIDLTKVENDEPISLQEDVKLGHFEPEVLNVNIDDLRKGIAPEFPKDPPPEMIDGYSVKSRLAPKKIERDPFIKITKKDLAKNHRLKDSEIKDFMDTINAINEFIKKHPEELIYAQQRYPKHDPRLAQLNWQMDQMLDAGKEYMDKHYPENQRLFNRIQKKIKNTIDQTDPKNFKGIKLPKFDKTSLEDFKRKKEVYSRFMKKPVKTKKLFQKTKKRG